MHDYSNNSSNIRRTSSNTYRTSSISFSPFVVVMEDQPTPNEIVEEINEDALVEDETQQQLRQYCARDRILAADEARQTFALNRQTMTNTRANAAAFLDHFMSSPEPKRGDDEDEDNGSKKEKRTAERAIQFSPYIVVLDQEVPGEDEDDGVEEFYNEGPSSGWEAAEVHVSASHGGDSSSLSSNEDRVQRALHIAGGQRISTDGLSGDGDFKDAQMVTESGSTSGSESSMHYFDADEGER